MNSKKLDLRSVGKDHIIVDVVILVVWTGIFLLMPDPGIVLANLMIGSLIVANIEKWFFEGSFLYYCWFILASIPIALFVLSGFLWYEGIASVFLRNWFQFLSVILAFIVLFGVIIDLFYRVFILRWNNQAIKDLYQKVSH